MRKSSYIIIILSILLYANSAKGQYPCPNNNTFYATVPAPTVVGNSASLNSIYGGEYITITGMIANNTYLISTCASQAFDTEISIYPSGGGAAVAYNDDKCGVQSAIYFTPLISGSYDVLVNEYPNCGSNSIAMSISVELNYIPRPVITIPVVVHVIWSTNAENISDAQIQSQIQVLNEDFRRLNSDIINAPPLFRGVSADPLVEFCLAQRDPNGNYTSGILRRQSSQPAWSTDPDQTYYESQNVLNYIWDRDEYLNIFVANIDGLGYTYRPQLPPPANEDAIHIDYTAFGMNSASPIYNKGRTATHEIGHWLGLYHLWGPNSSPPTNCLSDNVDDTPTQQTSNLSCPSFPSTSNCFGNGLGGDMFINFMDYTPDACMNMFSFGQISIFDSQLLNGLRAPLQSSPGCLPLPLSWDCISPGNCQDPGTGQGAYSSLAACQSACVVTPTWNCISPGNCQDPGTGQGAYSSLAACQSNCIAVTYDCINGTCIDPGNGQGSYSSLPVCQSTCSSSSSIWCDDFSNAANWIFTNSSIPSLDWSIEMNPMVIPISALAPMSSTSVSNGFLFISSDAVPGNVDLNGTPVVVSAKTATPIDLSAHPNVQLTFEHNYSWWKDTRGVRISADNGATWQEPQTILYPTGGPITDENSYPNMQISGNPEITTFDISAIAGGQSQVLIEFYYDDNDYWAWYWAVDDVCISQIPDNSVAIQDEVFGGWWVNYLTAGGIGQDYTYNPMTQATANPYSFEAVIKNTGVITQAVTMRADVSGPTGPVISHVSNTISLAATQQDTFVASPTFTPTVNGVYTIDLWGVGDSAGQGLVLTNTSVTTKITEVTDYTYGKDADSLTGYWRLSSNWANSGAFEIGADYDIYANDDLYSIDVFITDWSVPGTNIYASLYEIDAASQLDPIPLASSDPYTLSTLEPGTWVNIPFLSPQSLTQGTRYCISIGGYMHPTDSAGCGISGGTASLDRLFDKDDYYQNGSPTWYTIADIPMLRMNFEPITSPTWDCISPGNCQDPGTGQGTYASLTACQAACVVVTPTWDCISPGNCQDPGTGQGTYASLSSCQSNCIVVTPTWDCISPGNCQDPGTGQGTYASLSACNTACPPTLATWDCDGGVCIDPGTGQGTYASLSSCQSNCVASTWNCEPSTGICSDPGTGNGTYASLSACEGNCIQTSVYVEEIGSLIIYPNPNDGYFTIEFSSLITQDLKVKITNAIGEIVFVDNTENYIGEYKKQINLKDYANGIYFLEIETHKGTANKKIVLY